MPGDWPRYMSERRLRDGGIAYYWAPQTRDLRAGCPLHAEALGRDLQQARDRADMLNRALDDWRNGRGADRDLDMQPGFGTLDWLVERYRRSPAWDKVSDRARPDYTYVMQLVLDLPRKSGTRVGEARLASIDAAAADKIHERMKTGPRGPRVRVATQAMMRLARAWDVVHRLHRRDVPADNPFRGIASAIEFKAVANNKIGTIYDLELVYAGLFRIKNLPDHALEPFLLINCPSIIFPFLRRLVADITREGGFPPLLLDPIDFASLFVRRQQEMAQQEAGKHLKS